MPPILRPDPPNLIVRDPETMQPLPPEGKEITVMTPYWHRRVLDGDVVVVAPSKVKKES